MKLPRRVLLLPLAILVAGCGGRKDATDPDTLEIGIDEDALPEAFDEGAPVEPRARDSVRSQLREKGIRPGYDEQRGLLVAVEEANAHCPNPCSDKGFADLRVECMGVALKNARRDILECIGTEITIENENPAGQNAAVADDANATKTLVQRDGVISGASVILSAESWRKGEYEFAVAVVISPKLRQDITDRLIGKATEPGIPGKMSLREWLDTQDFSVTQGPRSFVDDTGERHYLGIGAADAEAATGAALRMAQTKAQALATKYAAFPFPTRIHSKITIRQSLLRDADGNLSADENLDEEYTEEPVAEPREIQVVLQTEAVHPISGRKMAVVVVEAIP